MRTCTFVRKIEYFTGNKEIELTCMLEHLKILLLFLFSIKSKNAFYSCNVVLVRYLQGCNIILYSVWIFHNMVTRLIEKFSSLFIINLLENRNTNKNES